MKSWLIKIPGLMEAWWREGGRESGRGSGGVRDGKDGCNDVMNEGERKKEMCNKGTVYVMRKWKGRVRNEDGEEEGREAWEKEVVGRTRVKEKEKNDKAIEGVNIKRQRESLSRLGTNLSCLPQSDNLWLPPTPVNTPFTYTSHTTTLDYTPQYT